MNFRRWGVLLEIRHKHPVGLILFQEVHKHVGGLAGTLPTQGNCPIAGHTDYNVSTDRLTRLLQRMKPPQ